MKSGVPTIGYMSILSENRTFYEIPPYWEQDLGISSILRYQLHHLTINTSIDTKHLVVTTSNGGQIMEQQT
jgi:hypothetical protein